MTDHGETIEIIQALDGKLIAVASWGKHRFTIDLPGGFESWEDDEQRSHIARVVVPRLKFLVNRTKVNKLRGIVGDPALHFTDYYPDGFTPKAQTH